MGKKFNQYCRWRAIVIIRKQILKIVATIDGRLVFFKKKLHRKKRLLLNDYIFFCIYISWSFEKIYIWEGSATLTLYLCYRLLCLRDTSHYGRRSRGPRFSPMKFQEIKSSASQLFKLKTKFQRPSSYMAILFDLSFDQSNLLSKEIWVERPSVSFIKK